MCASAISSTPFSKMTPNTVEVFYQGQPIDGQADYCIPLAEAVAWARSGRGQFMDRKRKMRDTWAAKSIHPELVDQAIPGGQGGSVSISSNECFLNGVSGLEPNRPDVRRARRKIKAWPFIGDTLAIRVGPRCPA